MISYRDMPAKEWEAMCTPMHCILPATTTTSSLAKPNLAGSRAMTSPFLPPAARSPSTTGTSTAQGTSTPALVRRQTSSSNAFNASNPLSPNTPQPRTTATGGLYLGSWVAAVDDALLAENNIRAIVEVLDAPWASTPASPAPGGGFDFGDGAQISRYKVAIADSSEEGLLKPALLDGAVRFIGERIARGQNVLVHCQQGISRSASIVTAYLMRSRALSYDDALAFVRERRPCAKPNPGFQKALREWATVQQSTVQQSSSQPSLPSLSPSSVLSFSSSMLQVPASKFRKGNVTLS